MAWYLQKRPQLQYNRDESLTRRKNTAACVSLSKSTMSKTTRTTEAAQPFKRISPVVPAEAAI
jgi:hypothetical protein